MTETRQAMADAFPTIAKLPLSFDADALARDLAAVADDGWIGHFNRGYHNGGWAGAALRAPDGDSATLTPGEAETDTPLMAACPAIAAALGQLQCDLAAVRLLRLAPGGIIREHRDYGLKIEEGLARLHIPILTGAQVEFYSDGRLVPMGAGECWYLDFDRPHRVQNFGNRERVHLVIDCHANDWLLGLVRSGDAPVDTRESGADRFDAFRRCVLDDPGAIDALFSILDVSDFVDRAVAMGAERGFRFTSEDVAAAMRR